MLEVLFRDGNALEYEANHLTPALSPTSWRRGRRSRGLRWVQGFDTRNWFWRVLSPLRRGEGDEARDQAFDHHLESHVGPALPAK
jgi:hypothetical protein